MTDRIDFDGVGAEEVVIRTRYGVAVYENGNGDIVIRQDGGLEEDAIVVVQRADVDALVMALQSAIR